MGGFRLNRHGESSVWQRERVRVRAMKDRRYKTGGQWIELFRRALGVGHGESVRMLRVLEENGTFARRLRLGWGVTYALRDEGAALPQTRGVGR